jgi:SAM-dependent methyltransferase
MPYADGSFDVVLFHTCLTHVREPQEALSEAYRVLRPGGRLAIFEGDYATTTVAVSDNDPLQDCVEEAMEAFVNDRWLVRRLSGLVSSTGFEIERFDPYGYLQASNPDYILTLIDRGADVLVNTNRLGRASADSLKQEARDRVKQNRFFGFISFAGLIAERPNSQHG